MYMYACTCMRVSHANSQVLGNMQAMSGDMFYEDAPARCSWDSRHANLEALSMAHVGDPARQAPLLQMRLEL